jgi:hypothetical protein
MLKAIATKINITPEEDKAVGLLGYGDFKSYTKDDPPKDGSPLRPDPLYARILMLRQEKPDGQAETVVLVGLDCCWVTETTVTVKGIHGIGTRVFEPTLPSGTCSAWAGAAGVATKNLSIHPTHTHYAPGLTRTMADKVKEGIQTLRNRPDWKQVTVHGGVVKSNLCRSRLPGLQDSSVDQSLIVLDFRDQDNQSVAHLVNFGVHPIFLEEKRTTSADFVGVAMGMLEERTPGLVSLFLQGWSGDLEPNYGRLAPPVTRSYQEMKQMAAWLTEDSLRALGSLKSLDGDRLKVARFTTTFPVRETGLSEDVTFLGIAIGTGAVLVAVSGEMYHDYGYILTEYSGSFMPSCGLANGYSGYIPTTRGFEITSYETNTTPFTDEAEQHVRAAFQDLFKELR